MKYYRDETTQQVYGFDETLDHQLPYLQKAVAAGYTDITGLWPPAPEPIPEPVPPTKEQLLAELQALTAKIEALSND